MANLQPALGPPLRICCLGVERIGTVTMMTMARYCPNVRIRMVDFNHNLINRARNGVFDFFEPDFDDLRNVVLGLNPPRFEFVHDMAYSVLNANIIFIATGMKPKTKPAAKKGEPDWTEWANAWKYVFHNVPRTALLNKIMVDITTLPLDFERLLECAISPIDPGEYRIVLNPSFISQGTAIADLGSPLQPPSRIVIASRQVLAGDQIIDIYNHWVPLARIFYMPTLGSAIFGKLGVNLILSSQIVSMNALNNIITGLRETEMYQVSRIITSDPGIGDQYHHNYGVGFGGPGLEKCLDYLSDAARQRKLGDESALFKQLIKVNESTKRCFVKKMKFYMGGTTEKIIAILGFTYKSWTNSFENSPAIQICLQLVKEEGATRVNVYDPRLVEEDIQRITEFSNYQTKIRLVEDAYEACDGADAICILTPWDQFLDLDFADIFVNMRNQSNANIFYGRWMNTNPQNLNPHPLTQLGFRVYGIPFD